MQPGLERLWLDVETERIRLRARYAGIDLSPRADLETRRRAVEWIRDGAAVDDEAAYLEWLEEQRATRAKAVALSA